MPQCPICSDTAYNNVLCGNCEQYRDKWISLGLSIDSVSRENSGGDYKRVDAHTTFLEIARIVAKRSPDAQTQCGCVIVKNNRIISTGYNGWNSGSNDDIIPNVRPNKYKFVIHAELNALLNAAKEGVSVDGAVAYITGPSCPECSKALIQCNIKTWYIGKNMHSSANDPVEMALREFLVKHHGVTICQL